MSASAWTAQLTVTACLTAFLYEGFTYNAVFLGRVLPAMGGDDQVLPLLIIFNTAWGLALWSYLRTSWADPGAVPEEWHDFVRRAGIALPIAPGMKEWQPGKATMCKHCSRARPERSHHCALCGVCILRLDHHCPWINNCVGMANHKFFLQTCFYALLACLTGFLTSLPQLVQVTKRMRAILHGQQGALVELEPSDEIAFIVFGALAIFISMFLAPLLFIQARLAVNNRTTIEDNYHNMVNPFDQGGYVANLAQLFGHLGPDWLLPVYPLRPIVDGITFTRKENGDERSLMMQSFTEDRDDSPHSRYDEEQQGGPSWRQMHNFSDLLSGEALWRAHYGVIVQSEKGNQGTFEPSTLDYMLGCMQMDCDGDRPNRPTFT